MVNFEQALAFVLKAEGGYVNNPLDHGGETNQGITAKVYDAYRVKNKLACRSVKFIESREVAAIYIAGYWNPCKCAELPSPLNLLVFDMAVNSGPLRALKTLQSCLGVDVDGIIGTHTLQAIKDCNVTDTCHSYLDARDDFYMAIVKKNPTQEIFLRGWISRTNKLRALV